MLTVCVTQAMALQQCKPANGVMDSQENEHPRAEWGDHVSGHTEERKHEADESSSACLHHRAHEAQS